MNVKMMRIEMNWHNLEFHFIL